MNERETGAAENLRTECCLVIPDVHQKIEWVRAVLDQEKGVFSHLLFLGDLFDSHGLDAQTAGVSEVCRYFKQIRHLYGEHLTILLGNHDLPYLEAKPWCDRYQSPRPLQYRCPGFTASRAKRIAGELEWDYWRECRLFRRVNGWILSHAGIAERFWYPHLPAEEAMGALENACSIVLERLWNHYFPILGCGHARGGSEKMGGIVWQDFDQEFSDDLPFPQIVGHTPPLRKDEPLARQKGRSWCLDGAQTVYGILSADGNVEVKSV